MLLADTQDKVSGMKRNKSYESSPIKRKRRGKTAMQDIRDAMQTILAEHNPMTVRQVFYQCVFRGIVEKVESEYKTVCRLLSDMRREKQIRFDWIADSTRWMRKPRTYSSLESALQNTVKTYRRAVWDEQNCYVEIWLEKDALAGVIAGLTGYWDVPLMVTRGYPSLSYVHNAALEFIVQQKPCYLYYLGDYDPSGLDIPRKIESDLREFAPNAEIHFERVAVNPAQIEEYSLPTRPTKKTDTRAKTFVGESVEVDAIPPEILKEIVNQCILGHMDLERLEQLERVEQAERETLRTMILGLNGGQE